MKEKIIHLLLIMFAGFLWYCVYFIMEKVNMIECKTAKLEQQQNEILYHMRNINDTLNQWELYE